MIPDLPPAVFAILLVGVGLSIALPLIVAGVALRGYWRSNGNTTTLQLAIGIVLITAVPTLMRLGFGTILPGGAWAGLLSRLTELVGLLVVLGVMHGE